MQRRKFLGFLGGAAVAGPQIAQSAVAQLPSGLGAGIGMNPMPPSYGGTAAAVGDGGWKLKEIANIKRLLSGQMSDEEKEDRRRQRMYQRERIISQDVACLVSVSGVRKLHIYQDRMDQHHETIRLSEARSRLHWLLRDDT